MANSANSVNLDLYNFARFVTDELRASSPYRTGNMQRSIALVEVSGDSIKIIISVDYASYVNDHGIHQHWINRVLDRCSRAYSQNNVENKLFKDFKYDILGGD